MTINQRDHQMVPVARWRLERLERIEEAARLFLAEEERWFRTTDARPFDAEASARASRVKHKALDELEAALKSEPASQEAE